MAKLNFFLEKRRDKLSGEIITYNVPIFLDFSFDGKRLHYYTGLRIDASKWDDGIDRTKAGKVSRVRNHPGRAKRNVLGGSEINDQLTDLISRVNEICDTAKALKIPLTVEYLRNELKNDPAKKRSLNVFQALEQFIEERKTKDSENTLKKYKSTQNHFKGYCGKKTTIEFQDMNLNFL